MECNCARGFSAADGVFSSVDGSVLLGSTCPVPLCSLADALMGMMVLFLWMFTFKNDLYPMQPVRAITKISALNRGATCWCTESKRKRQPSRGNFGAQRRSAKRWCVRARGRGVRVVVVFGCPIGTKARLL